HLGALLVLRDRARQLVGQRVEAGKFDLAVVDRAEVRGDRFVVIQDRVVVVDLVQFVDDRFRPLRVVGLLAVRRRQDAHDVASSVAAVHVVGEHRRLDRLAAVVVEAALRDFRSHEEAEKAAAETQRHHHPDHYVSVAIYSSAPPGEHVKLLIPLSTTGASGLFLSTYTVCTRAVSSDDSGRNGCSHAPCSGSESRPTRGRGSRNTPGISSRSTKSKLSEANAQLACSRNPSTWTAMPDRAMSSSGSRNACPSADATSTPARPS